MPSKEQYLVTKLAPFLDGCQIDIGYISPLVAQQPGNGEVGIQFGHTACGQLPVLLCGIGVPEAVEGHGTFRIYVFDFFSVLNDKHLQDVDGSVCGYTIWDQQLMSAWGNVKAFSQCYLDGLVEGYSPNLAALAFDGYGAFTKRLLSDCSINAEAFVNAKTCISGQVESQNIIIPIFRHSFCQHSVELSIAPCPIRITEPPPFQFNA